MDHVLHNDQLIKPATVGSFNEFMLTGRMGTSQAHLPIKKLKKLGKISQEAQKAHKMVTEAERSVNFMEYLRKRERDLAFEETAMKIAKLEEH